MPDPGEVPHVDAHAEVAAAGAGVTTQDSDSEENDGLDIQHAD